jgi:hypothetical protein
MLSVLLLIALLLVVPHSVFGQSYDVEIFANVPGCGNEIIEAPEQCDGSNLGGSSCKLVGFSSGSLSCSSVCTLVTTSCVLNPPQSGGTQIGFEVKSDEVVNLTSNLVVTGYSAPFQRVSLLRDGVLSGTTFSDASGYFQITLSRLTPGDFLLKLVSVSDTGVAVMTDSFIGTVYKDTTTKFSGLVLPPFSLIRQESNGLRISGVTIPGSIVYVDWGGQNYQTTSESDGRYSLLILPETAIQISYRVGVYFEDVINWSQYYNFKPAEDNRSICESGIDLNDDCRVGFVDFAIMLWWYLYNREDSTIDFDGNGKLDLVDFSILAYYWTG